MNDATLICMAACGFVIGVVFVIIVTTDIHSIERDYLKLDDELERIKSLMRFSGNDIIGDCNDLAEKVHNMKIDNDNLKKDIDNLSRLVYDIASVKNVSDGLNELYKLRDEYKELNGIEVNMKEDDNNEPDIPTFFFKRSKQMEDKINEEV